MPSQVTNDVNLYATHSDLADELGSARKLKKLVPADNVEDDDPTLLVRQQSLRDVLKSLARRTPPITESMLSDRTEIKDAIVYGALMRLYRSAMTTPDDINNTLYREYKKRFDTEIFGLQLTVSGATVAPNAVRIWRG